MRPKSIATVVVVFSVVARRSSTPRLATVIGASVVSGSISDTAPTRVVLPTPNPPATNSFNAPGRGSSKGSEGINHRLQYVPVRSDRVGKGDRGSGDDGAPPEQVGQQDLDHGDGQVQMRGDLRHRGRTPARAQDARVLGSDVLQRPAGRRDERDQMKLGRRARPAASHGV